MSNSPDLIPISPSPSILTREAYIYPSETLFTQLTNRGGSRAELEILEDAGWDLEHVDVPRVKNSRVKCERFPDSPGSQRGPGFPSYFAMLTYASSVKLCRTRVFVSPHIVVIHLIHFPGNQVYPAGSQWIGMGQLIKLEFQQHLGIFQD